MNKKLRPWVWAAALSCVFLLIAITPWVVRLWSGLSPAKSSGEFGDQFGFTNALFSGLALAAVAITLYLQTKELEEQRRENDDTQQILDQQRDQLRLQSISLSRQTFESFFFRTLDAYNLCQQRKSRILSKLENDINSFITDTRLCLNDPSRLARSLDTRRSIELGINAIRQSNLDI